MYEGGGAQSIPVCLAPFGGMAVAGAAAAWWNPGRKIRSSIQHLAAGIVLGAVGTEILPDVMHRHNSPAVVIGFAAGVVAMLGIRAISRRAEASDKSGGKVRFSLIAAVGVDVFVDGMLIGVGFILGQRQGVFLAFALTGCAVSLGLATASALLHSKVSPSRAFAWTSAIALLPPIGAALGALAVARLKGVWMEGVLAFTCAALLYLVVEELLLEAHETEGEKESAFTTATFFLGFLIVLIVNMFV